MISRLRVALRNWALALLAPIPLLGVLGLPRYAYHWVRFLKHSEEKLHLSDSHPCLLDWMKGTPFDPHYFYQAAWLARRIASNPPRFHVDIGSDVRLINVLSAFVPTEFVDFRPLSTKLDGLVCRAGNITALDYQDNSINSLSCLHVVEHVGLGRYGDPIDPDGSRKALSELQRVLAPGGRLFLSVPTGRERICFNAHRVFASHAIVALLPRLKLIEFSFVDDHGAFTERQSLDSSIGQEYGCGMFIFEKHHD
jgi:SAM-dependent methyltransferase